MPYRFTVNQTFSLGVEVELQLVDAQTLELANRVEAVLLRVPKKWKAAVKKELMQSYCELNTCVCSTVGEADSDLREKLAWATDVAAGEGMRFIWAGTHPSSPWHQQKYSKGDRYKWLTHAFQDISRRLVAFGLHVHVGVDSGDKAVQLCDRLLRHLPTLLALSANSPFWNGRDTGLASYRTKILESLPTAGLPQLMRNWSEFVWLIEHLRESGFIQSTREIWWDVRPHKEFGTVEIRVMDMPLNLNHTLGIVALTQSLVAALSEDIDHGAYQFDCHPMIAKQNKWHATRFGLDAQFINPSTLKVISAREAVVDLVETCRPMAERLECVQYLENLNDILKHGTGAQRQREVFKETGSTLEVARFLADASSDTSTRPAR